MATGDLIDLSGELPAFADIAGPVSSFTEAHKLDGASAASFNVSISQETLSRYSDALDLIKKLTGEGVQLRAQQAHSQLEHTKKQMVNTQTLMGKLHKTLDTEKKEYEKLSADKWYPGKILKGKAAHEEKKDVKEKHMQEAEAAVEHHAALLAQLAHDASRLTQECAGYDEKMSRLTQAKKYEASIVEQLFAGSAGDAKENELEKECVATQQQLTTLTQYRAAYGRTQQIMKSALQSGKQAESCLEQALRMAGLDVAQDVFSPMPMMNGPGGLVIDVRKRQLLEAGTHQLHVAAEMVLQAKQMMPSIPNVDLDQVKRIHKHPGMMMDMVFDNVITDMRSRRVIQESLQDVKWLNREIAAALRWVEQWLQGRISADYAQAEAKYAHQKSQLDEYRRACMQRMIAAQVKPA